MNLTELAADGLRYREIGEEIGRLMAERDEVGARLIAELGRRKADSLVGAGGVVVTTTSRRIGFDVDKARELLRPGVFRAVTKLEVDGDLLEEQRKAGKVGVDVVKAIERRSKQFPKVTPPKAA